MVIDTSAILAIFLGGPERQAFLARQRRFLALNYGCCINLDSMLSDQAQPRGEAEALSSRESKKIGRVHIVHDTSRILMIG
jgi:hypothetical protein